MGFSDAEAMDDSLELARRAGDSNEVPVGALIARDGQIIGRGFNQPISSCDPTAHAEIVAIRDAAKNVGNYRLPGSTLYVTIEPCAMCAGAIVHARIDRVVFGAREPKAGALVSQGRFFEQPFLNWRPEVVGGVMEEECASLMRDWFAAKRREKR